MSKKARTVGIYSAGHFLVDLVCMFLYTRHIARTALFLDGSLLYNFLAFAGQLPIGLAADRLNKNRFVAALGCGLVATACFMGSAPLLMCATAGLGNAMFHVGGGLDTLNMSEGKSSLLGLFVSPGAFGLFLGSLLARTEFSAAVPAAVLLFTAILIIGLCRAPGNAELQISVRGAGAMALLALFLVVVLRSYTGFVFSFAWKRGIWLWIFTAGVVMGKAAGGILSDRFGAVRTSAVSLALSAGLFLISGNAVCGVVAVLLFNMTMPITLRAAADLLPGAKGLSFGLLTFALFLGFVPTALSLPAVSAGWMYALLAALSLALLLPALEVRR